MEEKTIIKLAENKFLNKMGDFYRIVKRIGNTSHVPSKNILERIFGPNAWYKTTFSQGDLQTIIFEHRNSLALDEFLDSITIYFNGKKTYAADVHSHFPHVQLIDVLSKKTDWRKAIDQVIDEYS